MTKILSPTFTLIKIGLGFYSILSLRTGYENTAITFMFIMLTFSFLSERILIHFKKLNISIYIFVTNHLYMIKTNINW